MSKVIIFQGLPGSGKSTKAKYIVENEPNWVRVNKDSLREMLLGKAWTPKKEKFIKATRDALILQYLAEGKNVIVDDTNFGKHIEHITQLVKGKAEVIIEDFTIVPLELCIQNDLKRPNSVGKDVIIDMYNRYLRPQPIPPIYNPKLEYCIVVDMDGTLSLLNGRNPFDASTCEDDPVNGPVLEMVHKYQKSYKVIIVSGRTDDCMEQTLTWLAKYNIDYTSVHLRKTGDQRKDSIVKEEIYREFIEPRYNVEFVLDDRKQVIRMWQSLGLFVFAVSEHIDDDF